MLQVGGRDSPKTAAGLEMSKEYMFACLYITKIALVQSVLWETGLGKGIREMRMKVRRMKRKEGKVGAVLGN